MSYAFFALLSRMKFINRWALMRNAREENLSEHCLEVGILTHALCLIGSIFLLRRRSFVPCIMMLRRFLPETCPRR